MYRPHPCFQSPSDENIKIWRYMDFTKFISMLENKSLFLVRADRFEDPFEGSFPRSNRDQRIKYYNVPGGEEKDFLINFGAVAKLIKNSTMINCWHINDFESAAMWKLYLKSNEGIAIQSTFQRLCDCFNHFDNPDVHIGVVNYINYDSDQIPEGNSFYPFLYKRKSFEHEHELRVIWTTFDGLNPSEARQVGIGAHFYVNLEILIEKIYIAPTAPAWFKELVTKMMSKYFLNKEVIQSSLDKEPFY